MSVYIHGMEMPKTGYEDVRIFADGSVTATSHNPPYYRTDYRAVPVPDHGRLIDADALMERLGDVEYKGAVKRVLIQAPTIIPADFAKDTNVPTKAADKEAGL